MYAKKAVNEKIAGYRETAGVLPTSIPRRVGLLAGIRWTKSQSPGYFPGPGPCLQIVERSIGCSLTTPIRTHR